MRHTLSRRGALALIGAAVFPAPAQADASPADQALAALGARWLDQMARASPVSATQIGDHRFDNLLDDVSAAARAADTANLKSLLADLDRIPKARLSRAAQIDAAMLGNQLRYDIWTEEVLQSWAWDPLIYNEIAGGALYSLMAREFAPLPVRLAAAIARMEHLPGLLAQARQNLDPARVPLVHAQTLSKQNPGLTSLVDELITPHAGVLRPANQARLKAAQTALAAAVSEHQTWIDKTLVPAAKGDFRLGARLYDEKLAFALNTPLTRAEIRQRAQAAVVATRAAMYAIARAVLASRTDGPALPDAPSPEQEQSAIKTALDIAAADRPAREDVVSTAEQALAEATAFVQDKDLITLPTAQVKVILMPEFQRGVAVAYCDAPGPLEKGLPTFYAVSPVPEDWSAQKVNSFLREYNRRAIHDIATHEAMPGHYVQLAHSAAYPSTLRSVLWSGSFVEGWAVYAEGVMADAGFTGDPLYKLVVLKTRLRSITNALLDQGIHADGMSREAAMTLMMETAFQEEGEASGKWIRASVSAAQLPSYFVGFSEHTAIRQEAERRWGKDFTLKRYHDAILAFGSPPARFARAELFGEAI